MRYVKLGIGEENVANKLLTKVRINQQLEASKDREVKVGLYVKVDANRWPPEAHWQSLLAGR